MKRYAKYLILITILFLFWVEPSVGNIIYRTNSKGCKSVRLSSALSFMMHPLYNQELWHKSTIDINYPAIIMISTMIILSLEDKFIYHFIFCF